MCALPAWTSVLPSGVLLQLPDRQLAVHLLGNGAPPVVFLPGAGMVGLGLLGLHIDASTFCASVLYDRGGTGWSDSAPLPRSAAEVTDELHLLLEALELSPPYILVGHSLGGAYARRFAQRFPEHVGGLVLLDPAHEDIPAHMPAEIREARAQLKTLQLAEPPAELIAFYRTLLPKKFAQLPKGAREALVDYHLANWRTGILEASNDEETVYPELRNAPPLPDVPVIVLGAMGVDADMSPLSPEPLQRAVNEGKKFVNTSLAASLPQGEYRELLDASHAWMHLERPDAVVKAIRDVVHACRR